MSEKDSQFFWELKKRDSGEVYKNIPLSKLKSWILEARVEPNDYVRNVKLTKWVKASAIQKLQRFFMSDSVGAEVISSKDIGFAWKTKEEAEEVGFDLTPMIDVTFLLLIFFMVTATFAIHEVKNIQVPKSKYTKKYKQEKISVGIDKNREVYINDQKVTLETLKAILMKKVEQTAQQDIVLKADKSLDYGLIIAVLDEINGAGIKNVKLKLEKK